MKFNKQLFQKLSVQNRRRYRDALLEAEQKGELEIDRLTTEQKERLKRAMDRALKARE